MVTLAWGDLLSLVLPGAVALLGVQRLYPAFNLLENPNAITVSGGFFLLFAATLAGAVLEGMRRVLFDELLRKRASTKGSNLYAYITPANQALFEMLVQSSYKYQTFYGNLCCALYFVLTMRHVVAPFVPFDRIDLVMAIAAVVALKASFVQGRYFEQAMAGFIEAAKSAHTGGFNL